jgi:hypothetical protein
MIAFLIVPPSSTLQNVASIPLRPVHVEVLSFSEPLIPFGILFDCMDWQSCSREFTLNKRGLVIRGVVGGQPCCCLFFQARWLDW